MWVRRSPSFGGCTGWEKSAIANFWAHTSQGQFDGGDLFGDFSRRRYSGAVDVGDVLADLLRDLGTADAALPTTLAGRQKLFSRLTAAKRYLVFLDDVDQSAQVQAIIPSGPGSVVLATTNSDLEELVFDGAKVVEVEPLDDGTAGVLLRDLAGSDRIDADPDGTARVIRACAGLPIALCVCGGRLANHPTQPVSWVADRVAEGDQTLRELSGPGSYAVDRVFDFAYGDLSPSNRLVYRRLGLHPGGDFVPAIGAILTGRDLPEIEVALGDLTGGHLVETVAEDRFRFHDLIRHHTRACVSRDDLPPESEAALSRLVDWYCAALRQADRSIVADRLRLSDLIIVSSPYLPAFQTPAEAFGWFGVERHNVMAVQRAAFDREWDQRVWLMGEALWPLCASHHLYSEWIESQELASAAGERLENAEVVARMRSQLARAYAELGEHARARTEMATASEAAERSSHDPLKASVIEFDGVCRLRGGAYSDAVTSFASARRMFERLGNDRGVGLQDLYAGTALAQLGERDRALVSLAKAVTELGAVDDPISVGRARVRRGEVLLGLGRHGEAREELDRALAAMSQLDIPFEQADALEVLALVAESEGSSQTARGHRQQAYRIYKQLGDPRADALLALIGVGPSQ